MSNQPRYWNKPGKGKKGNKLCVLTPHHSLLIEWMEMSERPKVYKVKRLISQPKDFEKAYTRFDEDLAAEILLSLQHDLQTSMPFG